jgi:putative transposase
MSNDHVHILVSASPTMSPSEIIRLIEGRTSAELFQEHPHFIKRYWGRHFGRESIFVKQQRD